MKCEIYKDSNGLEYVDACLPYTEFSRMLYTEEFIITTLKLALDLRNKSDVSNELIIKEVKRLIKL